jgi:hypothetical protein
MLIIYSYVLSRRGARFNIAESTVPSAAYVDLFLADSISTYRFLVLRNTMILDG